MITPRVVPSLARRPALLAALAVLLTSIACGTPRPIGDSDAPECQRCHGGASGNAAPPRSTHGDTAVSSRSVGAHQAHVAGTTVAAPLSCDACHPLPPDPRHRNGVADVELGPQARRGDAAPAWSAADGTCAGTYCHGATLAAGGDAGAPSWTAVDGTHRCDRCHGNPPAQVGALVHPASSACHACHPLTVREDGTIDAAGGHHMDGVMDVGSGAGASCDGCHGAPPDTGAHRAHARPPSLAAVAYGATTTAEDVTPAGADAAGYAFGCGQCHPLDPSHHQDGIVEVELSPAGAPAGSLRAANAPDAAYAGGTCSGVACHSSGQATPAYRTTPAWSSGEHLGCDGCHDNPPGYASGGAGTDTANSHLGLGYDGWEFGHFGGMPGPWHPGGPKHGGGTWAAPQDAAPITCQSCHFETVDPANTGPSGFYYLDTSGSYDLGGQLKYACATCHGGANAAAPLQGGKVRPLRHVNGRRDVVFDPRTTLPPLAFLPAAPFTPTRPIWVTDANFSPDPVPHDAVLDPAQIPPPPAGTTWPFGQPTLSLHLGSARYDPATKSCTSVACHLDQPYRWGDPPSSDVTLQCTGCHASL